MFYDIGKGTNGIFNQVSVAFAKNVTKIIILKINSEDKFLCLNADMANTDLCHNLPVKFIPRKGILF